MRDADMRVALHARLALKFVGDRIRDEMGLCLGATRVDVAVVNGSLHGYEIKSDRDTLVRLPAQVELYNRVLDYSTIVCGEKYVERISEHVPDEWGIIEVAGDSVEPAVFERRPARRNSTVDPIAIAQLLWRDEAAAELVRRGERVLRRETRWDLWDRLACLPMPELQNVVRTQLKARPVWPTGR
ncbi:hypothetical protein BS297_18715 [Rhodococcus erythropolis]|jgi:hypothetical protein|uniref:Sce7726 family protein n=1 Tax=Rhodococcus erythropolis TaxID=1833 RepID=A0A5N5E092_RHOER|nr:hypothetical protein BS297_18715 [Rhodococcus erythropolis]